MEKSWLLLFLVGALLFVDALHSIPKTKTLTEKLTVDVKEKCYLDILETLQFNCNVVNNDQRSVPHGESCRITDINKEPPTVKELVCNDGHWSGTDFTVVQSRQKRFWGLLAAAVGIGCAFFCGGGGGDDEHKTYHPPKFPGNCKPREIQNSYYVEPGKNRVRIHWTEPTATDEDRDTPIVRQSQGLSNGDEFPGSVVGITHYIRYDAKDEQGLTDFCAFHFTVYVRTCDPPSWPANGYRQCNNYDIGSRCHYSCNDGYKLSGSNTVTCQSAQTWSHSPRCERVSCNPPQPLANGTLSCNDMTYSYGTVCMKSCHKGFDLQGQLFIQCGADGSWSTFTTTTCVDNSPPSLTCKTPQIFYADRSSHSTAVTWVVPMATDKTDSNPNVIKTSGPSMNDIINVGSEFVTYMAVNKNNVASTKCVIELQVKDITCGHPKDTLQDAYLDFNCSDALYTYGVECQVSCLANLPLNGTDLITCERNGTNGVWSWKNDFMPYCRKISCPDLDPPTNGALVYDSVQTRPAVVMMCNDRFDIPDVDKNILFTGVFLCLDKTGWVPFDHVPDCVKPRDPVYFNLPLEIYYYKGDCGTNETEQQIKLHYEKILESNYMLNSICPDGEKCTVKDLVIECGPIENIQKRSTRRTKNKNKNAAINVDIRNLSIDAKRRKRWINIKGDSSHDLVKRQAESHRLVVKFKIVMNITVRNNETLRSKITYYRNVTNDMSGVVQTLLANGSLDIDQFTTDDKIRKPSEGGSFECTSGYVLDKDTCKPCPAGHYLNETSKRCIQCPIGQYYRGEGSTECVACPKGYTTKQIGSKSINNCTKLCHPGSASPDGMSPCAVCLYGKYQDEYGQTSCKQCPSGTTTKHTNSTSSQDCKGYDVLIEKTGGQSSIANIPSDINDMSLTFWVKRFDEQTLSAILKLKTDGNDFFVLYLTEDVRIYIPEQIEETVAVLNSTTWTNVVVTLSSSGNSVEVYINGNQVYTSSVSVSAPVITNGEFVLTNSGTSGIYMTGLRLLDKVISTPEIALHASICNVIKTDDVINMGVFQNIDTTGITLMFPSTCDVYDDCDPDPCNGHQCIDGYNTFTCHCSSGWSGDDCTVAPNYCTDDSCKNGATCISQTANYTCNCLPGYTGSVCEVAQVNGGWSEWTLTSPCNKICGTGSQNRTRSCDSPPPNAYGNYCVGENEDKIPCNTQACEVCDDLVLKVGTQTNCTTDEDTGNQLCTVYCQVGKIMQPGYPDTVDYICGPSTLYKWNATELMPSCVEPSRPTSLSISTSVQFSSSVKEGDKLDLIKSIIDSFKSTPCSNICQVNVNISNTGSATISYSIGFTGRPNLGFNNFVSNGHVSPPLQQLVDSIDHLEMTAQLLANYTSEMFNMHVNGQNYTVDKSSVTSKGEVHCLHGQVSHNGVCVFCPAGTYFDGGYCTFCERGSYQPSEGQSSCVQCPAGLTTETVGSTDLSKCIVYCPAGTYSDGTYCHFCEKGSYQPEEGQSSCIQCPVGLTTETVGSTGLSKCSEISSLVTQSGSDNESTDSATVIIAVVTSIIALMIACTAFGFIWFKKRRQRRKEGHAERMSVASSTKDKPPSYEEVMNGCS